MEEVDDGPHDEAEIVELGKVLFLALRERR